MVEDGFAWWYEYYCGNNKVLARLHNNAKSKKLGLWAGSNPVNPYEWRKKN
jgi:micrococcal nuclease